jgi:nucleotide-binding universal stress UspA family protein
MIDMIAVGTDGSVTADRAVEYALDLAVCHEAELLVLSAYGTKPSGVAAAAMATAWVPPGALDAEWTPHEAKRVEGVLADAKRRAEERGVTCRTSAFEGDPAEVLVELASAYDADLLVIGNRGMKRRVLGSVPNTVTHNARCSVLIVKTDDD